MQAFEPQISAQSIYRYLGYKGQKIDKNLENLTENAINICKNTLSLKHIKREFMLGRNMILQGTDFELEGSHIKNHLQGCDSVVLLAATCGLELDILISRLFVTDKTLALLVDGAGSVAIEEYLDYICAQFGQNSTSRFSCGYGDFPLSANKDIIRLLNAQRLAGIKMTADFLLSPKKSVTAVVGLGNKNAPPDCNFKCQSCGLSRCLYRK